MGDPAGLGHLAALLEGEGDLEAEELVEDQPAAGSLAVVGFGREVNVGEGGVPVDQVETFEQPRPAQGR